MLVPAQLPPLEAARIVPLRLAVAKFSMAEKKLLEKVELVTVSGPD